MNDNKEVNIAIDSLLQGLVAMDFNTFEVSFFTYDPLISNGWTKRILKMIDDLKKIGLKPKEVAGLFPNMSEARAKMIIDLWMAKYASISSVDRYKIANFYIDLLNAYCLEDPYAFEKNIVHLKTEIDGLISKTIPANPKIAKKLGRLVSGLYHLAHALYSDMYPSIIYENYGPYDVSEKYGSGHMVAIKDFGNLRSPELWPDIKKLPWMNVNIVNVYKNVSLRVDAGSHGIYAGDMINGLKEYYLTVDGKEFSIDNVDEISKEVEQMAIEVFKKVKSMDFEAQKEKYYHQKAYVYKKIYDYLGQDWKPSEEILNEAKNKPLHHVKWPIDKDELRELLRKALHPEEPLPKEIT